MVWETAATLKLFIFPSLCCPGHCNLMRSRYVSSPLLSKEHQPHEQPSPGLRAAATPSLYLSNKHQLGEQPTPIRGAAATHAAHSHLRSSSHTSSLSSIKEQQLCEEPAPIQEAPAWQGTCPCPRSSSLMSSPPHLRNSSSMQLAPSKKQQPYEQYTPV
uniref:Uncharacterized protein n=1 Tax=Pipistrellus kuhlii TaxID=59472 RepID=A0A7J7ZJ74_PIPKU|nr:hypothetical protein mPipKuh1_009534 [Pipistrellus kuhlii]